MAKDVANNLNYFLLLDEKDQSYLGSIRHWENLKVGFDEQRIWLKDLDYAQMLSVEIQTLPSKKIYSEKEGKLFPVGSLLPEGRVPSVMWTPIDRAFPVKMPSLNHNYFGLNDSIEIQLVETANEQASYALLVSLKDLESYLETAASVRLKDLSWTILNEKNALIIGTPILPLEGAAFWLDGQFLFPAGFSLELRSLNRQLETLLEIGAGDLVLWHVSGTYTLIRENELESLTRSSFQLTGKNSKA